MTLTSSRSKTFHNSFTVSKLTIALLATLTVSFSAVVANASRIGAVDPWNQVNRLPRNSFPWQAALKDVGLKSIHICGDRNILPTKRSIKKSFHVGPNKSGYLLTGLFPMTRYFQILTENNLKDAKSTLKTELSVIRLWKVDSNNRLQSMGPPKEIKMPFTASVKDCVEGARTTMGNDCSKTSAENRVACCREKFIGPVLEWHDVGEVRLNYSPDPSVSLDIAGESVRYCNVTTRIDI